MQVDAPVFELYALKYATRPARRGDHFVGGDAHDGPMPMAYYIWVARSGSRAIVIDTGFSEDVARRRGRTLLRDPIEALGLIGVDPASVEDVVITHLHYDHAGNLGRFPKARFHVQLSEIHHVAGPQMRHPLISQTFEVEDVVAMIRMNFAGRVVMHEGQASLCPGVTLHPGAGHTPGLQFVRVFTGRGWVTLASDASHYYEHVESGRPFTVVHDVGAVLDTYDSLRALSPTPDHIIPGHDPAVTSRYPALRPGLEDIVVRLDATPLPSPQT